MRFRTEDIAAHVRPADDAERRAARDAIEALARPRMTGSAGAARVADDLRERFDALGYEVREIPFQFSAWPGRYGLPAGGAVLGIAAIAATGLLIAGAAAAALIVAVAAAAIIGLAGVLAGAAIDRLPWSRVRSANWFVRRPGATPRFLIMAHRDSKSQRVSTFVRTAALAAAGLGWAGLLVLALAAIVAPALRWTPVTIGAGALTVAAAVALVLARADNESPGALDNASGLAALLAVAARERGHDDIAFVVTDAEELGLAGARALRHHLPPVEGVINLDGLDDEGDVRVVERHGWPRRGFAPHLTSALLGAAAALDVPARRQDLPPAILVDHVAVAETGLPSVSLMRGTADSLRRVHRPSDTADRLDGAGAASTAAVVSGALELLRDETARRP